MPRGRNRAPTGGRFAAVPEDERRELVAVRLPRASAALLRALADLSSESQSDVIAAALERYDAYVRRPPRKRVHAVVA